MVWGNRASDGKRLLPHMYTYKKRNVTSALPVLGGWGGVWGRGLESSGAVVWDSVKHSTGAVSRRFSVRPWYRPGTCGSPTVNSLF